MARDMYASVSYKDIRVELTAENCSWNPDIASDMVSRVKEMFEATLQSIVEYEGIEFLDDEDDVNVEVTGDSADDA